MWFPIQTMPTGGTPTPVNSDGVYEIDFAPSNRDQVLQWISLTGPAGSSVYVYIDTTFIDTTPRGDFNRADYFKGIPIARGRALRLVWNVGTGTPTPVASIGTTDGVEEVYTPPSGTPGIFAPG